MVVGGKRQPALKTHTHTHYDLREEGLALPCIKQAEEQDQQNFGTELGRHRDVSAHCPEKSFALPATQHAFI